MSIHMSIRMSIRMSITIHMFIHKYKSICMSIRMSMHMSKEFRLAADQGIEAYCVKSQEVVNIADVEHDKRFSRKLDELTRFRTASILSGPITNRSGSHAVGVVQALNKLGAAGMSAEFSTWEETLFSKFIQLVSISYNRIRLYELEVGAKEDF